MSGVRKFDEKVLLQTVLDLFWRNGWQATSLNDISKETGIQRGSLYNAYKGKDELFILAFDIYAKRFLSRIEQNMVGESIQELLMGLFKTAVENMTAGFPPKGCLTTKMIVEIDLTNELVQKKIESYVAELIEIFIIKLSSPKFENKLRLPPNEAADLIFTFLRGIAVMEKLHYEPEKLLSICNSLVKIITIDNEKI